MGFGDWLGLREQRWSKAPNEEVRPAKTAWDVLQVAVIPAALVVIALAFNAAQASRERSRGERQSRLDHSIAAEARRADVLDKYLERMEALILDRGLRSSSSQASAGPVVARTATLTALRRLDDERQGLVVKFLWEARLLGRPHHNSSVTKLGAIGEVRPVVALGGADLRGAEFAGAELPWVHLSGVDLRRADLRRTTLFRAELIGADLRDADLGDAVLSSARLRFADLRGANLRDAEARFADLRDSTLEAADLNGTNLRRVWLHRADLRRANLENADLRLADLRGANLRGANLRQADLRGADLRNVDLRQVKLDGADLQGVKRGVLRRGQRGRP